jgi:hypothetical protein
MTSIKSSGSLNTSAWERRLLGAGVVLGLLAFGAGALVEGVAVE